MTIIACTSTGSPFRGKLFARLRRAFLFGLSTDGSVFRRTDCMLGGIWGNFSLAGDQAKTVMPGHVAIWLNPFCQSGLG